MIYYHIHVYYTNGEAIELRESNMPTDMIQFLISSKIDPSTVAKPDCFSSEDPYFWAYKWDGYEWVIDRRGIEQSFQ